VFEENDISWELIGDIDQETLKDIGIGSAGHRLQILKAAKSLRPGQPASPASTEIPPPGFVAEKNFAQEISGWSRTPGERKPVTMLFADIVSSTALTENLDAEAAHDLLYRAAKIMCIAVENNKGTVCRFMGDGIMAMFGAPVASERHALEACSGALDMQRGIANYALELESSHASGIQIRVGLHSGEVVVLEVGDDPDKPEYDASGSTVPLAARMEQSARAGSILISEQTRALAGDAIDTCKQPAIKVKGIAKPVVVHQLSKVLSGTESSFSSARHPIVGRKSELAQFRGLVTACLESRYGQTVFVRGEAGIGKTRLVEEMTHIAREKGFTSHKALVLDFGAGKGQGAIPSLVRSLLGVAQGCSKRERESALDQAEKDEIVDADNRAFLNDLLDLDQPPELKTLYEAIDVQARKEGKRAALVDMLLKLASRHVVFIVVEDLHWADSITLDYLARIAAAVAECPALMVLTSRAEGDPVDTTWRARAGEAPIVTWDLSPLRKEESAALVSSFLDTSESLAKRCIDRAAGNPLFLEQLLLSVGQGTGENIPDSIKSLVLARMDQLAKQEKQILQAASVLGQRFDLECLRFLIEAPEYECHDLVEHHLLRPEGTQYIFAHALIQEGAYASLIKPRRLGLHHKAAQWYAKHDAILYAEHLAYAEDEAAAAAFLAAAREQYEIFRPERALQLIRQGLEIALAAECFEIFVLQGEIFGSMGSAAESIEAFRRAGELTENDIDRCRSLMGQAEGLIITEDHEALASVLGKAEAIAQANTLYPELSRIYNMIGAQYFNLRQSDACLDANQKSLAYARQANSPEIEAKALSGLADAEYTRGHLKLAYQYFDQCIEIARTHGYSRSVPANLAMRAEMSYWKNDFTSMKADLHEALELAENTHHVRAKMITLLGGKRLATVGDLAEGETWLLRGLDLTSELGWNNAKGIFLCHLAKVAMLQDDLLKARKLAQEAVDGLRSNISGMSVMGTISLGTLALTLADPVERHSILREAETYVATGSLGYILNFYEDAIELSLQMREWDEAERYAQLMEDHVREEPLPRCDFFIGRGRALAAYGRGNRDQVNMAELKRLHDEAIQIGFTTAIPGLRAALETH
jgi:class 3 adenylate cyclase/tetratricopeptide (TPR) repeat protein